MFHSVSIKRTYIQDLISFPKVLYSQDITDQLAIVNFLSMKSSWFSTALWSAYGI